jgi:hypothetical protein
MVAGFAAVEQAAYSETSVLARDDLTTNRHPALVHCLSMIASESRFPLSRIMDHAQFRGAGYLM